VRILPRHNPAVFYYDAADPEAQLSAVMFVALVVIPLVVLGLIRWWARGSSDE